MTDGVHYKLTGTQDVIAAFRELREELPKEPLRTPLRKAATLLAQYIALVAPKLTGRLARNISVKTSRDSNHTLHGRVVVNQKGGRDSPDNAFYWRFLEEGWQTRNGVLHKFPFIRGVVDAKGRAAAQLVIDACEKQVDKAQKRIARAAGSK